jgi:signal transduction histidine kinase
MSGVDPSLAQAGDILVVDDTVDNLKLLMDILTGAGYHARPAANGELALRSALAKEPALVLLDIMMPEMDGFEVCRRLKQNEHTRDIPVVFLSGLADTADKSKGFALGAVDYVTKPFHADEVLARVRVHLALAAAKEQLRTQNLQLQHANEQLSGEIAERKRAEQALEVALARMQALSERITRGQEEERYSIAYELHEQLGQELASVNICLTMLKPHCLLPKAKARLQDARDLVELMMTRIRDMSLHLRPSQLDTFGLYAALQSHCTEQSEAAGWVLHFDVARAGRRPQPNVEIACFRLAQEALANIADHANATEVWVSLREDGDELHLCVRDNGIGFNAAGIKNRPEGANLGLMGMAERARQVGGRMELESSPGNGAEIRAVLPLIAPQG